MGVGVDTTTVLAQVADQLMALDMSGWPDAALEDMFLGLRREIDRLECAAASLLAQVERRGIPFARGDFAAVRGLAREHAHKALDAAMDPPGEGDERSLAKRRADAIVAIARFYLDHADTPLEGGERPHVHREQEAACHSGPAPPLTG